MEKSLPSSAKVVVIGGGVAGCSVAYHLAKFGWKDTILLERDQLTSGTTWHAAGLVGQLGATATITKLRKYSLNLYKELEIKTGLSTGLKQNGSVTVASSKARLQELLRQATAAQLFDVNVEVVDQKKIKELYPVINNEDLYGGVYIPNDGQADPVGVTNVLAKAAKMEGAQIFEKTPVKKILVKDIKIITFVSSFQKFKKTSKNRRDSSGSETKLKIDITAANNKSDQSSDDYKSRDLSSDQSETDATLIGGTSNQSKRRSDISDGRIKIDISEDSGSEGLVRARLVQTVVSSDAEVSSFSCVTIAFLNKRKS